VIDCVQALMFLSEF